ncbi:inactive tyrosine-protein kinase 7-like isoform X2 [Gigantopelta aegis]|uniref:inactive tyrosine-protein kinase 7-like isoform X2 n=1 Tax=Gigantopelta aegis TaxID=1735272 RepID=UPI001B888EBA|nr:inactive tyrosine-protein kinase 7-like isoform X2 [Gigantopelta aegis]
MVPYLRLFILTVFFTCHAQDTFYFSTKPADMDVVDGTETKLRCDVSNRRHIIFQWVQHGKPVENTTRRFQEDSNLRILRVSRDDDQGPFQCIATNVTTGFSLQSFEARLNIQWIEDVADVELRRPQPEGVTAGVDVTLRCEITGNPEPSILWYHNKFRLFNTERVKILDGGVRLKLTNITSSDNGIYSCRAENVAGAVDSRTNFLLNVRAPNTPHLREDRFTAHKLVLKNSPARLDCYFVGAARIDWFSNYEKLSNTSRHTIFANGSLYFPRVRSADEGSYRCEGLSENSPAQTFTSELELVSLDDITADTFEPRLRSNFPIVLPVHEPFEIKVFPPKGNPKPSFRWLDRNDMLIGDTGRIHVQDNRLVFENPQEIESGNYTFIVNNTAGEKRHKVWITVSVPPFISRAPQPKEVEEGEKVEFSCQVVGTYYPVTTIVWLKDNSFIHIGSSRHRMNLETGVLHIEPVLLSDAGEYACVANTTGHPMVDSSRAYLRVTRKLKFNPYPQDAYLELNLHGKVECHAEAETRPVITWIKHGNHLDGLDHVYQERGMLLFQTVRRSDEGYYSCIASLRQRYINSTIFIKIIEGPRFAIRPENTTAFEGHAVMLHCVTSGVPKPSVSWDRNRLSVPSTLPRYKIFDNGTLLITKVFMEDKGIYGCLANNTAGQIRAEIYLRITDALDDNESFDMMKTIIIAVCCAGAYLALVIGLTAFCSYKRLSRRKRNGLKNGSVNREQHELLMKDRESGTQFRSDSDNRSHASGLSSHQSSQSQHSRSRRSSFDRFQFPRQDLHTLAIIGKCQYGDVFLAKARSIRPTELETLVVVKSLLSKEENIFFNFRQEMEMYSKLDHVNIVKLLGMCREMDPQFLITEYCDWGDVKQFLLATRGDNGQRIARVPALTTSQKVRMCHQVSMGMEHMSMHRFVHRDLAARNILLTSRLDLKISSLSLSMDVYASEYYPHGGSLVPLRWLAPEALQQDGYCTKSDVWAYGVYVWEVFHLADLPFRLKSDEELLKELKAGEVCLECSEQCPYEIVDLIRRCTAELPQDRPTFSDIVVSLRMLHDSMPAF